MVGQLRSLEDIQKTLLSALGSESMFSLVNTRLILATGVDLKGFAPAQSQSPEVVTKVLDALGKMGFSADTLLIVAQRKGKQ